MTRKEQAKATKKKVFDAAIQVIEEQGFDNASIEAITTRAGVSTGTFYTYFASKNALLAYSYDSYQADYETSFENSKKYGFPESILVYLEGTAQAIERHGKEVLRAVNMNLLTDDFKYNARDPERDYFKYMRMILKRAQDENQISSVLDIDDIVRKLYIIITGCEMYWCLVDFQGSLSSLLIDSVRASFDGILNVRKTI